MAAAPFFLSLPAAAVLPALNAARELLAERGMGVLGTWALLTLLVSGYYVTRTDTRTEPHYFHQMNIGWGVVNALLAVWGLVQAHPNQVAGLTLTDSLTAQFNFEKVLLLNVGLDAAYICTGSWLRARAGTAALKPERLRGFGRSLWVQGGFLLLFDAGFYVVYHRYAALLLQLVP
ncbi:hypothetical protein KBK19_03760 [Microvirga sp. STR05]|uniref:Uncharacterized protein n=1 Tax=Hymenobacter duratus TaxID=2771356 RepID=A0ABR8JDP0_9BACT|nr:hypothetical protein [Hymenobacter duratus]MBD2714147.1 hypothetical protein [Hymenobacter duratus]MBR7949049.1 hypothetical protein [Microvirga sp. STR05]